MYLNELWDSEPGDIIEYAGERYLVLARKRSRLAARLLARWRWRGAEVFCDVIENGQFYWSVVRKMEEQDESST